MKSFKEYLKESHMISEMSKAFDINNKEVKATIWVENPNHRNNKYFKIYNDISVTKADSIARIDMLKPRYILYSDNLKNWTLKNEQVDELIKKLKSNSGYKDISNWEELILIYNKDNHNIDPIPLHIGSITKEQYELLVKEVNKTNKDNGKNAISIFSPMPDYTKLKTYTK